MKGRPTRANATVRRGRGVLLSMGLWASLAGSLPAIAGTERAAAEVAVGTDALERVRRLAEAGGIGLALARLEQAMPAREADPVEWLRWEKTRVSLWRRLGRADAVVEEAERLRRSVDPATADWLATQAIEALLETGRPAQARRLARRALWHRLDADARLRRRWRVAVLEAWLAEGRLEEARITLQKLEQEDRAGDDRWAELHARILLRLGEAEAAWERLREAGGAASPLVWLAALRSGGMPADQVLSRVQDALQADPGPAVAAALRHIEAEAFEARRQWRAAIRALEQAGRLPPPRHPELFGNPGARLWRAYLTHGRELGNRLQLLQGRDEGWYFAATERLESAPVDARALFAVLADSGSEARHRALAHDYLARQALALDPGGRLLRRLYLDSGRYPEPDRIPAPVRRRLVEIAVDAGDLPLASRLAAGLPPPAGESGDRALHWNLLRARLLILGGQVEQGIEALREQLRTLEEPAPERIDRILQVIFDLQRIDEHASALALFEALSRLPLDARHRRELWYWIAESRSALGRHRQAGEAYLLSAVWLDPHAMDPWAQTARYHAAVELERAGLLRDALRLLDGLRRATRDPDRRTLLEHRMQRIRAKLAKGRAGPVRESE